MPKWHFQLGLGASLAGEVHQVAPNLIDALSHDADRMTQRQFCRKQLGDDSAVHRAEKGDDGGLVRGD
jgi:hypothetical protein